MSVLHQSRVSTPRSASLAGQAQRRRTILAAAGALALHLTVLAPLVWLALQVRPPETVIAVEITPSLEMADAPPATQPVVPESAAAEPDAAPATQVPAPASVTPVSPPALPTAPPEPVQALAAAETPPADRPAAARPVAPPSPPAHPLPHPARPAPPHLAPRPAPALPEALRPAEAAAPAVAAPAATPPAPPPAALSNAIPTWRSELVGQLQRAKRYPDSARSNGEQGVALATFTMDRAGHVVSVRLVRSSGSAALDEEALAMIRRAEPLPPPPAEMAGTTFTLTVPVTFALR